MPRWADALASPISIAAYILIIDDFWPHACHLQKWPWFTLCWLPPRASLISTHHDKGPRLLPSPYSYCGKRRSHFKVTMAFPVRFSFLLAHETARGKYHDDTFHADITSFIISMMRYGSYKITIARGARAAQPYRPVGLSRSGASH